MQKNGSGENQTYLSNSLSRWILVLIVIGAGITLGLLANRLPDPVPDDAPATAFSAQRAMRDVHAIAARPHPTGSPEIEETRRYLMARMTALGLDPQMRTQDAVSARRYTKEIAPAGRMRNIVGVYRGTAPALPAILVMAHYDTAPLSPGAGDDTSGVAAALEIARALRAAGPLRRSVVFLFTDGEEAGLIGASAFFAADPLRHRIGLVLNLEARGDSGKALMFQTSTGNARLIDTYSRTIKSPAADSLMATIYKRMPNDTDLTVALDKGLAGMNFAFVGHQVAYHTALSTPDRLNVASLQHMGDQLLPLVRSFGEADSLDQENDDSIFTDLFGLFLIVYPPWVGWLLAFIAVGATFSMTGIALVRRRIGWRNMLAGAGGLLAILLGIATLLMLAIRLAALIVRDVSSPYALIGQFDWLLPATLLLGLGTGALLLGTAARGRPKPVALFLLVAGLAAALLGTFSAIPLALAIVAALLLWAAMGRPQPLAGWFAGAMTLIALLALVMQILLPNGAHMLVWPLLLLAAPLALLLFAPERAARLVGLAILTLPALLIAGLTARSGYDFFLMMGASLPAVATPFLLLTLLALAPLLWSLRRFQTVGMIICALGLGLFIAAAIFARTPTADNPDMVEAFYIADLDKGRGDWVSAKLDRAGWVHRALTQDGGTAKKGSIAPISKEDHWIAPAKTAPFHRPQLLLTAGGAGKAYRLTLQAANRNGGRFMRLYLKPSVELRNIRIMDQVAPGTLKAGDWTPVTFHASGADTVRLTMDAVGKGRVEVQMIELVDQWPRGSKVIPLPPHSIAYRRSGNSLIMARTTLAW